MEEKSAGDCSSELFWSAQRLTGKKNPVRQKRERNSFNVNGGSFILIISEVLLLYFILVDGIPDVLCKTPATITNTNRYKIMV